MQLSMHSPAVRHVVTRRPASQHVVQPAAHTRVAFRHLLQDECCCRNQALNTRRRFAAAASGAREMEMTITGDEGALPLKANWSVQEGVELLTMPFSKPLGAVLAEQKGRIVVEKILDGSNAAEGGLQVGDVIRGTTGRSKEDVKETRAGSGSRAKQDYWGALVLVNADDQSFDTVMAAINSSRCASCDVTLVVERKKGSPSEVSPDSPNSEMFRSPNATKLKSPNFSAEQEQQEQQQE